MSIGWRRAGARTLARTLPWTIALAAGACAGSQPEHAPAPPPPTHTPGGDLAAPRADAPWPVKTRYVVDLWLHGFALISVDTTQVPLFRRGYRDEMVVEKNKLEITTLLDVKHDSLAEYLQDHPALAGAQFLALYERNWDPMFRDIRVFLAAAGNPKKAKDQQEALVIATFAQSFPGAKDRHWLDLFATGLQDESVKFYQAYWSRVELARRPVLGAADSLWTRVYLKVFRRFQGASGAARGDIFLSLPLGAEGRTILGGKRQNVIAAGYPGAPDSAVEVMFVIAHEGMSNVAATAVGDNTTPSEKRAGVADRYISAATVRGGALLVEQLAPQRLAEYQAFYLTAAGARFTPGQEAFAFRTTFPLPDAITVAMKQALASMLGGI